jgi:hypothetical protein
MLSSISTSQISQSDSLGALTERRLSKIAHFGLKRAGPVWVILRKSRIEAYLVRFTPDSLRLSRHCGIIGQCHNLP